MTSKALKIQGIITIIAGLIIGIILGNYYKIDINDSYYREDYVFNFWMFLLVSGITDILGTILIGIGTILEKLENNTNVNTNSGVVNNVNSTPARICNNCGASISSATTICSNCGANTRPKVVVTGRSNAWVCPKCGRENQNYVGTCGCGERKPQ